MIGHGFLGGPGWIIGGLFMVIFWTLVIVLVVGLVRGRGRGSPGPSGALRILEDRYARGEVDREEFLERRRVLLGEGEPTGPASPPTEPT